MEQLNKRLSTNRIHTLLVPLARSALLVPSALVAEVVNVAPLQPIPLSETWSLGLMSWRSRPVPVVSYDALLGDAPPAVTPRSKIIVFYPLEGRAPSEFFGIVSTAEPQPRTFQDGQALSNTVENNSPYLAMSVQLDKGVASIPDLNALKKLFYPA